jgi:CRISPR/Cas system CSM-associated protein Csm2 small subunit
VLLPHPPDEAQEIEALYRFMQEMCGQATLDDDFKMLEVSFA